MVSQITCDFYRSKKKQITCDFKLTKNTCDFEIFSNVKFSTLTKKSRKKVRRKYIEVPLCRKMI